MTRRATVSMAELPDLPEPVVLRTDRLVLRDFTADDLFGVAGVVGDPDVTHWLSFDNRDLDQARAMLATILANQHAHPRTEYYLAITLPELADQPANPADGLAVADDEAPRGVIGFIRLGLGGVKAADLGYALRPAWQHHGYASEAAAAMIDYGFDQLGLHRIIANIGPANTASLRLVKSLGFTREGTFRDHVFTNGAWRDSESYTLLEHEWATAAQCEHCGKRIPPRTTGGRAPKFCSTAHRQAAYRARQQQADQAS